MFEIKKNVPVPAQDRAGKNEPVYEGVVETFKSMMIGECFDVPKEAASPTVLRSKIKELLTPVLKENEYYKYLILADAEGKGTGLRIWKIESEKEQSNEQGEVSEA